MHDDYKLKYKNPKLILDCGANIGFASVFYANLFPKAKIIAVEPETKNYRMLIKNTQNYANIKTIEAGIWSKKTFLKTKDNGIGSWAFTVKESASGLPAISINDLTKSKIDLIKIDIEGSEKEVFKNNTDWLKRTELLIIELHDELAPGATEIFNRAVKRMGFRRYRKRENIILTKYL